MIRRIGKIPIYKPYRQLSTYYPTTNGRPSQEKMGVYKIECLCKKVYVGKTGRSFGIRKNEHAKDLLYDRENSTLVQHVRESKCVFKDGYV